MISLSLMTVGLALLLLFLIYSVVAGAAWLATYGAVLLLQDGRWVLSTILAIVALGIWGLLIGMIYDGWRAYRNQEP